jgi:hypothetical protein
VLPQGSTEALEKAGRRSRRGPAGFKVVEQLEPLAGQGFPNGSFIRSPQAHTEPPFELALVRLTGALNRDADFKGR